MSNENNNYTILNPKLSCDKYIKYLCPLFRSETNKKGEKERERKRKKKIKKEKLYLVPYTNESLIVI